MHCSKKELEIAKHTLLAVVGHSPQVVSESIYALYKHKGIKVDNLKIVTTATNKENVLNSLSAPRMNGKSVLQNLSSDYNLPHINFSKDDIWVPHTDQGQPIQDVKSIEEMNAVSHFLLHKIKALTSDTKHSLHASLAGGRKTMTFYLSYAMSIYGRRQDSLSHVFVSAPYESSDFYYPTPYSQMITTSKGSRDAKQAEVMLSNIPYVQLRPNLPTKFLERDITFTDTESFLEILNAPLSLNINLTEHSITCSGIKIKLTPSNFAFYLMMVDDLLNCGDGYDCPKQADEGLAILYIEKRLELKGYQDKFKTLKQAIDFIENKVFIFKDTEIQGLKSGLKASFFNARKNEISKILRSELPDNIAEHYDIDSLSKEISKESNQYIHYFGLNIEQSVVCFRTSKQ